MKKLFALFVILATIPVQAQETCVTKTFGGVTTTRCKEDGQVTSVCKSREFAGKIITHCE